MRLLQVLGEISL